MASVRPSIHQIAKRANVSAVTVSRALSGKLKGVRGNTAQRILEIEAIAEELGYRPHTAARSMANGRFNAIGLVRGVSDTTSNDFGGRLTWRMEQALSKRGYGLLINTMDDSQLDDVSYVPQLLRELSSDGLIINYTHNLPSHLATLVTEHRLPVVWPNSKRSHDSVYPDDESAARRATELLLRLGHRRITYAESAAAPFTEPHFSKIDRRLGYEKAMAAAGLEAKLWQLQNGWKAATPSLIERLREPNRPTAIICYNFLEAGAAIMAANRLSLRVPTDLSIITMGSHEPSITGIPMTMLEIPVAEVGDAAVDMLLERLAQPGVPIASRAIPFSLVEGDTVGHAPAEPGL